MSLSGDIPVPHCRRCGSRQSGHRRQAWLARSGFSNIDKAKSRDRLKQNPAPHVYHWPGAADRALNGPSIALVDHRVGWEADIRTRQRMRRAHRALDSATEGVVVINFPDHRN